MSLGLKWNHTTTLKDKRNVKFSVTLWTGDTMIDVGEFTCKDTVLKVKQYYCKYINNDVSIDDIIFAYNADEMRNDKTLGYYNDDINSNYGMNIFLLHYYVH
mmetsp:Transcript_77776/g.95274  ORF Transcript_77776/g.95274 Transcript_77776/m.95274 type:complete len:102 (-) Transcript_77776:171-476(-)